ncbi:MAG: tRNA (N6-threonylcarbamoyladenosine(37)-N6)-methyltransferase TrmO [Lentisphaerae bacterium]|nr:MAG: tRNA (N6-threonylcarbamoyladenosine(37)-N6)-methyltransferase TrmO [Lentisphaerota bacterium]
MDQTTDGTGKFTFEAIAYYRSDRRFRFEVPRQGVLTHSGGIVEFLPHRNFDQALRDLEGFDRIWLIYTFHLNSHWKPFVRPPRAGLGKKKVSVFATRAPHRPNMIGLSCVRLHHVKGLRLQVSEADLLDGTPILDVKPYLPYCDSFPDAQTGWLQGLQPEHFQVSIHREARELMREIYEFNRLDLANFCQLQLEYEPANNHNKRIRVIDSEACLFFLGCRTWRIYYCVDWDQRHVEVLWVATGYSAEELAPNAPDPYHDKAFHRSFMQRHPLPEQFDKPGRVPRPGESWS